MDRRMAASLDHWLTTPPGMDEPDEDDYRCEECDEPLKPEPDTIRTEEDVQHCDGQPVTDDYGNVWNPCQQYGWQDKGVTHEPHDEIMAVVTIETRNCPKCGTANIESIV